MQLAQLNIGAERDIAEFTADRQNASNVSNFVGDIISPFAKVGVSALAKDLFSPNSKILGLF